MRSTAQGEQGANAVADKFRKSILWKVSDFPLRFRQKVLLDAETGCWTWTAGTRYHYKHKQYKYPVYAVDGSDSSSAMYAHRFAYEFVNGHILPGLRLDIDHICKNKLCVNPAHLRAITHQDNCRMRKRSGPMPKWLRDKIKQEAL